MPPSGEGEGRRGNGYNETNNTTNFAISEPTLDHLVLKTKVSFQVRHFALIWKHLLVLAISKLNEDQKFHPH